MAKKGMHVRISEEARAAWKAFAAEHGVTVTAVLEIAGRHGPDTVFDAEALAGLLVEARQLDHERRAAGGPRGER